LAGVIAGGIIYYKRKKASAPWEGFLPFKKNGGLIQAEEFEDEEDRE